MSDAETLQYVGTDAAKWAEKFCEIAREKGLDCDERWMIGWFANAMCASEEERREKDEQTAIGALGLLSSALAARCGAWDGDAPEWFPQPPEWLELWQKAVQITTADEKSPDYHELVESLA